MSAVVLPGSILGIFGGGQLGRMFSLAARRLGYRVHVFAPGRDTPTGQVSDRAVDSAYEDLDAVESFAREVDVITFEFENVPAASVDTAARFSPVHPSGALLFATQERTREKAALRELGLPVARYAVIASDDDIAAAARDVGFPGVLKTAAQGYDGKGQHMVQDEPELRAAWSAIEGVRAVYEERVDFRFELSVVAARGRGGEVAAYAPFLNHHAHHILDVSVFPAGLDAATAEQAQSIARTLLEGFDVCGVVCVEMFLLQDGALIVNEVAPRTHNSGHVTIDGHRTSQFEQQVRAICGLPLGSVAPLSPAGAMANLLGDLWEDGEPHWPNALADPDIRLHLYGKASARRGRKMGHLVSLADTPDEAERRARQARARCAGLRV